MNPLSIYIPSFMNPPQSKLRLVSSFMNNPPPPPEFSVNC